MQTTSARTSFFLLSVLAMLARRARRRRASRFTE